MSLAASSQVKATRKASQAIYNRGVWETAYKKPREKIVSRIIFRRKFMLSFINTGSGRAIMAKSVMM